MLTLLGSLMGFLGSALPQIFKHFQDKADKAHELAIMDKQIQAQKEIATQKLEEVRIQAEAEEAKSMYEFASKQSSGYKWVDSVNAMVRPIISYGFFFLFCYITVNVLIYSVSMGLNALEIKQTIWDEEAQALFAAIISFYFGARAFRK